MKSHFFSSSSYKRKNIKACLGEKSDSHFLRHKAHWKRALSLFNYLHYSREKLLQLLLLREATSVFIQLRSFVFIL